MQARKQRRGDVAPIQTNRIRHQGEQESGKKSEEGDARNKRKATKLEDKPKRKGKTGNGKRERKIEAKKGRKGKGVRAALC